MRWLCWCSAALLLAACGGGGGAHAHDEFAYSGTVLVRSQGVYATSSFATIRAFSFGGHAAFVVVPKAAGRHPAVLFLHGSGGNRNDLIGQAAVLAKHGFVTMTFTFPAAPETYRQLVVPARRALDVLAARSDVDPSRLGVAGFSLGGQVAAILAGDDPRVRAADVIAGRGNAVTTYWVARSHAQLFFQAGAHDDHVPHAQLLALMQAAPGRPRIRWYSAGHEVSLGISRDLVAWLARVLG